MTDKPTSIITQGGLQRTCPSCGGTAQIKEERRYTHLGVLMRVVPQVRRCCRCRLPQVAT